MTWTPKNLTREQQAERRQEGIRLLKKGQSQAEIARQLGVSPAAVCVWSRKLKKYGKESLVMQKATGRPPSLTKADKAELERILKETRALERDEELIRVWLSKDWARIKKSAAARRRDRI